MLLKIIIEILILWVIFALFMEILVRKRGPIGGIQYYEKAVQERAIELGLITRKGLKNQKICSSILLIAIDLIIPFIMIVFINGAQSYWDLIWQYYVLFMGQELYDWFIVDIWWVTLTDWWVIPGIEDLNYLWHDPKIKFFNKIKLIPISAVLAIIVGGGNQREKAREKNLKKQQQQQKGNKNSGLSNLQRKEKDAEIMRQKQAAAAAKKAGGK
ncbi:4F5-domain-containing protein [Anaeromyces robustus]|uniref:4F5-domain-containing protein n=1 Tax=Anaeromyces robustus TaxID=1754192 RepID=A0A1Y1VS56_9FUNG|nr:4F5-domain-containing protein [Anaeromyces robustus]|eukprot:ORX64109.1 4F5-domain-containing protein [Anaeromyces robustus]